MSDREPAPKAAEGRRYGQVLVVGLVSATATTVAVSHPWAAATASVTGLPQLRASVDGADVAPLAAALGVVLLASFGAVLATRGWVRRSLGALVVVCGVAVLATVIRPGDMRAAVEQGLSARGWSGGSYDASTSPWRWVAGAGAVGCMVAGLLVARFGGSWPSMGARYDPVGRPPDPKVTGGEGMATEADLWRSIDQGHDPTQTP